MSAASAAFTTRPERLPGMHGAGKPPPDALLVPWRAADSLLLWDENDGLPLVPDSALGAVTACRDAVPVKLQERRDFVMKEGVGEKSKKEDVEQVEDSLNVDEISELFSCVEQEETSGVDFSVYVEDEDAVYMEDISQILSDLEDSKTCRADDGLELTTSSPADVNDTKQLEIQTFDEVAVSQKQEDVAAENVAMLSEVLSAALEDKDAADPVADSTPKYSAVDYEDANNIDVVADLFTSLEESSGANKDVKAAVDLSATRDWIDALEVDNAASLFSALEHAERIQTQTVVPAPNKVDSRVFVPMFSVRIEGGQRPGGWRSTVGPNSHLLVGPPDARMAGSPAPSPEQRVGRWKSKRSTRPFAAKQSDPSLSEMRRASAAKRQRVKGRFVSKPNTFVSITALQSDPTPASIS